MKKLFIPLIVCVFTACGNDDKKDKDSIDMAKEENRIRDSSKSATPDSLAEDHDFIVEASSGGLMENML